MKSVTVAIISGIGTALVLVFGAATFHFWNENRELTQKVRIMEAEREQARIMDEKIVVKSRRNTCAHQLRMIEGAILQWALLQKKSNADQPMKSDLVEYLPSGFPRCPDGGTYTLKTVADQPRCSIGEHIFSQ